MKVGCSHGYADRELCHICPIVDAIHREIAKVNWPRFRVPCDKPNPLAGRVFVLKPGDPRGDA